MDSQDILYKIDRFKKIDSLLLDGILSSFKVRHYKKRELLFSEGENFQFCYIIQSGYAKVYKTQNGEDSFLTIGAPMDFLGEFAIFNGDRYPITAVAATPMTVLLLDAKAYYQLRSQSVEFCHQTSEHLFQRSDQVSHRVSNLTTGDAAYRVNQFIHFLANRFGTPEPKSSSVIIPFSLERKDIANAVNLKRETVIRIISQLIKDKKFLIERERMIVMPSFLKEKTPFSLPIRSVSSEQTHAPVTAQRGATLKMQEIRAK